MDTLSYHRCCVPHCDKTSSNVTLHNFPNPMKDPERFKTWVNAVGSSILGEDNDTILKLRRICHDHFEPRYHTRSRRLTANAMPTLNLRGYSITGTPLKESSNIANVPVQENTFALDTLSYHRCCVPHCNKTSSNVTLHNFPNPMKDPERFKTWVNAVGGSILGEDNDTILKLRRICHDHFEPRYHTRSERLTANAMDTLNLRGYSITETPLKESSNIANVPVQENTFALDTLSYHRCCVPHCNKTSSNVTLHNFPNPMKDPERFKTWVNAVGGSNLGENNDTILKLRRICHDHFEPRYHTRSKRLTANAMPTLNLRASCSTPYFTQMETATEKDAVGIRKVITKKFPK